MFSETFVLMTTLHRRLADSATVSAVLPTAPPDGQVSRASKDLEGSRFFTSAAGTAISPNNFRTKVWLPAPETAKIHGTVTFRDLRGARVVAARRRRRLPGRQGESRPPADHHDTAVARHPAPTPATAPSPPADRSGE